MSKDRKKYFRLITSIYLIVLIFLFFHQRQKNQIKKEIDEFLSYSSTIENKTKKDLKLKGKSFNDRLLEDDLTYDGNISLDRDLGYIDIPLLSSRYMVNRSKDGFIYDKKSSLPLAGDWSMTNFRYENKLYKYVFFNRFDLLKPGDRFYIETIFGKNIYQIEKTNKILVKNYKRPEISINENIINLEIREGLDSLRIITAKKMEYSEGIEKLDRENGKTIALYLKLIILGLVLLSYLLPYVKSSEKYRKMFRKNKK